MTERELFLYQETLMQLIFNYDPTKRRIELMGNRTGKSWINQIIKEYYMSKNEDVVNHPKHYQGADGMEAIDVIEAFELNFHLGNVVKYILRKDAKGDALQDLKKAKWYLDREIASIFDPTSDESYDSLERGITSDGDGDGDGITRPDVEPLSQDEINALVGIDPAAPEGDKTAFTLWDMIPHDATGSATVGWNKFHKDAYELALQHRGVFRDYDIIIGISRGGLVLAQILAYEWNIRDVRVMQIQAYDEKTKLERPKITYGGDVGPMDDPEILIVDSLADTGSTMRIAKHYVGSLHAENVRRMALYCKPDAMNEVDVYHTKVPQGLWLEFPWEREPKGWIGEDKIERAEDATSEANHE